jgi:uncharacterized FlaG/YvyC family protein
MQITPTSPITLSQTTSSGAQRPAGDHLELRLLPSPHQANNAATEQTIAALSQALEPLKLSLRYSRDEETGTIVISIVDEKYGETVRQLPTEATLQVVATLGKLKAKIFSTKA